MVSPTVTSEPPAGLEVLWWVMTGLATTVWALAVLGAVFGAYLLLTINRALPVLGIPDFWQRAVVGALIIGAIILDRVLAIRQAKRLLAERDAA